LNVIPLSTNVPSDTYDASKLTVSLLSPWINRSLPPLELVFSVEISVASAPIVIIWAALSTAYISSRPFGSPAVANSKLSVITREYCEVVVKIAAWDKVTSMKPLAVIEVAFDKSSAVKSSPSTVVTTRVPVIFV